MNLIFTIGQFHAVAGRLHEFSAEASELRLSPGVVPEQFEVTNLGNGQPFKRLLSAKAGDKEAWTYKQVLGCGFITIFND